MRNIKLNSKKIIAVILSGFVIITSSGCTTNKETVSNYSSNNNYAVENKIDIDTNNNTSSNIDVEINKDKSSKIESKQDEVSSETRSNKVSSSESNNNKEASKVTESVESEIVEPNDNEVVAYFDDLESNVNEVLKSDSSESTKDKLKGTFITIVDFIFYDGEIKGIKFDDLTEGAKQNILETAASIDNAIMIKFPNYKEEIGGTVSNAYNKASELIKKGAKNVKEFSKEKLGEENYNAIKAAKDELIYYTKNAFDIIGDVTTTIWDKGKEKVKNWYENFKNK